MKTFAGCAIILIVLGWLAPDGFSFRKSGAGDSKEVKKDRTAGRVIGLPGPLKKGALSVTEALWKRRTCRRFAAKPLEKAQLGQILWSAQGLNSKAGGLRTAPSAGALYPLEVYALVINEGVRDVAPGAYRYRPRSHDLVMVREGDLVPELSACGYSQTFFARSPLTLIIAADYDRTTWKYGDRGIRYVDMEAGHAAQNVSLQAAEMGLAVGFVGAFQDDRVSALVPLGKKEKPLYILPVGYAR
jgi:SagB-type dehydrogenase family enzyme